MFRKWWKTVLESGFESLNGSSTRRNKSHEKQIEKYKKELQKKNEIIADLSGDLLELKKQNGEL